MTFSRFSSFGRIPVGLFLLISFLTIFQIKTIYVKNYIKSETSHSAGQGTIMKSRKNAVTFFHLDTDPFLKIYSQCIVDPTCSIQYMHSGKTGGTFLETLMKHVVDIETPLSCCSKPMMQRFEKETVSYCNSPFSSYQVGGISFSHILKTCQEESKHEKIKMKRIVALFTYREPLATVVSYIHQVCNKNLHVRSKEVLALCARCTYDADPIFLLDYHPGITLYELLTNQTFLSLGEGVDFLALDNADITRFSTDLKDSLPLMYKERFNLPNATVNGEKTQLCNFAMTSDMIKKYSLDSQAYRNLTLGRVGA